MKSHSTIFATLALALAAGVAPVVAHAQYPSRADNPAPQQESLAAKRQKQLLRGIMLTSEQKAKVDSVTARYTAQLPMMQPGTPPDSATQDRLRLLMEKHDTELRTALTPEQQKVFDKNRAELQRQPVG